MIKYVLGNAKNFHKFVNSIEKDKKIGLVTHTDVDGLVSAVFLTKILESRNLNLDFIEFLQYGVGVLKPVLEKEFDYLFFTDWNADNYEKELDLLREKGKVLVLDHHPLNQEIKNKKGLIKTESVYCTSHFLYYLAKEYFNVYEFKDLFYAAIVLDSTFVNDEVFHILDSAYPGINKEKIFESVPGKLGKKIDNSIIYYKPNLKKVFDFVINGKLNMLNKINELVEGEIKKAQKEFFKVAEYYPEKKLYFAYMKLKYSFMSPIISEISHSNPDKIFILVSDSSEKDFVKVSSRNQNGIVDLNKLLRECTKDFKDASAGGHVKATGGSFRKKDLDKFKEFLLKSL